jgi:exodeoxyribonuclease-3
MFKKGSGFYTWWSHFGNARARNVGWRIDFFFVSKSLEKKVVSAGIHPKLLGSDHCPISLVIEP